MSKPATKTTSKVYAVLTEDFTYYAHNGDNVIKKGHRFDPWKRGSGCYIAKATHDLVLQHWVQYGDNTVIPKDGYKLVEEVTTTTTTKETRPYTL